MRTFVLALALSFLSLSALGGDLTVGWISRLPEIDYVWNSSNPAVEGWPAAGESVTWRAHVRSWFAEERTVEYVWRLDGRVIHRGTAALAPNASTPVDLPRAWTFERQRLSIEIDSSAQVAEESEQNNTLEVFTDALSVGMWVEQSVYDYFRERQHELGIGSTSWENWAQRLIELYNDIAAMAIYPETPSGVHDRWRLQKIVVVPDFALPLVRPPDFETRAGEPNAMTHPAMTDRTVDLQIGFPVSTFSDYTNTVTVSRTNPFFIAPVYLHELGHARYLTDVYAFNVISLPPSRFVRIMENGTSLAGGILPTPVLFFTPETGLMNNQFTYIDRYSAVALNRIAGRRATVGNYNDPENIGSFLNDLPAQNRMTIRDASGNLMIDKEVEIYQSEPFKTDAWYASDYDATPDLVLRTDGEGRVLVGRSPFAPDGKIVNWWRGTNMVAIVRVVDGGTGKYGFLESRLFNLASWRGETELADHELVVGRERCLSRGAILTSPAWDTKVPGPAVQLRWEPVADAISYSVYAANPGQLPRLIGTTASLEMNATLTGRAYWWVVASFANCPSIRSESSRVLVQARPRTRAVR